VLDETGPQATILLVAGGSAANHAFRADLADATGTTVVMPAGQDTDFSARGAAMLAAQSVGRPLPTEPLAPASVTEPRAQRAAAWDALWAEHERVRQAVNGADPRSA